LSFSKDIFVAGKYQVFIFYTQVSIKFKIYSTKVRMYQLSICSSSASVLGAIKDFMHSFYLPMDPSKDNQNTNEHISLQKNGEPFPIFQFSREKDKLSCS